MKLSKTVKTLTVILIIGVASLLAYTLLSGPQPSCTTTWGCAASYPLQAGGIYGVAGQQCGSSSTFVYCIGGVAANGGPSSAVYAATFSASGNITAWSREPDGYPQNVTGQACADSSGYLYCVGGIYNDEGDDLASSYYASVSSNGTLGQWHPTTAYPIPIDSEACIAWASYIYCVAGNNETAGSVDNVAPSSSVWFAPLGSSGIGNWSETTPYPAGTYVPTCYGTGGYVYCLGGSDSNEDPLGTAYFAPLSAHGVGAWTVTTTYPVASTGQACAIASGYIYCVGGETGGGQSPTFSNEVYFATISSQGIGPWKQAPNFPQTAGTTCVSARGNLYCMGGFDESSVGVDDVVNYASLASLSG